MHRLHLACAVLCLAMSVAWADNLVVNGDFEQPLEAGWTPHSVGLCTIERATGLDPDTDYEARVALSAGGYGRLAAEGWVGTRRLTWVR